MRVVWEEGGGESDSPRKGGVPGSQHGNGRCGTYADLADALPILLLCFEPLSHAIGFVCRLFTQRHRGSSSCEAACATATRTTPRATRGARPRATGNSDVGRRRVARATCRTFFWPRALTPRMRAPTAHGPRHRRRPRPTPPTAHAPPQSTRSASRTSSKRTTHIQTLTLGATPFNSHITFL